MNDAPAEAPRILVVDDDLSVRRLIRVFLQERGYHVRSAAGAEEALELLENERFDIVLTDLRLPVSSGLELLEKVRARLPGVRTMLMSGDADVPALVGAVERGVDAVLLKPFELEELRVQVESSHWRGNGPSAPPPASASSWRRGSGSETPRAGSGSCARRGRLPRRWR